MPAPPYAIGAAGNPGVVGWWPVDIERLRDVALMAARAGDRLVQEWSSRSASFATQAKGVGDYVTAADRAAEQAILAVLQREAPGIPVLAEESGGAWHDLFWAVDPLDGTTNFLRRYPVVGVSVALVQDGEPVAGAVTAPLLGASWCAARGLGAVDGEGRRVSVHEGEGRGVVSTGFPFRHPEIRARYLPVFQRALDDFEDLRRAGAASLDLAYAAQGSFEGFFELNLALWDIAAGALLVREAGGVATDWDGHQSALFRSGDIVAGAPEWHERMLTLIRDARAALPT
jgi:myo-inositol-1(or 4)-monophosphatase